MSDSDLSQVAVALQVCCQDQSANRIAAEQFLNTAEEHVMSFFLLLQRIYASSDYDEPVRLLAAIYFKNGIEKRWRKSSKRYSSLHSVRSVLSSAV